MNFEDMRFLFAATLHGDNRDRGILRMNYDEAELLWDCVKDTQGTIMEIGRRHGGSTVLITAAAGPDREVISVDIAPAHHATSEKYFADAEFSKSLRVIKDDSANVTTGELGLLFVDGDHSYEGVSRDIKNHWPDVVESGLVVFHDAVPNPGLEYCNQINHCPGVTKACAELVEAGKGEEVAKAGSVLVLRKLS